jgi:glutamate---cysteine ligase / carboxylate-amine ligase
MNAAGSLVAMRPRLLERQLRGAFDDLLPFTVGVEEELLLVDPDTLELLEVAEVVLALTEGDPRVACELRAAQIEAVTPICSSVADVRRELSSQRRLLGATLAGTASLLAVGTHPFADGPGGVTRRPRYQRLVAENPWAGRYTLTCGMHVHVAVPGADRALAVYNALRSYLPEIIALAANAPFFRGEDSGLATVRPKLNQCWPRAGVPPAFASWREVTEFALWARRGGAFPDESEQWWDLRLRPQFGTIEVRAPDVQTRVEDSTAVAALVQSLVYDLAMRYDAGDLPAVARDERIVENAWLATRDGLHGFLIDLDSGSPIPTAQRIEQLVERIRPSAAQLGAERDLLGINRIVQQGGGATIQRRAVHEWTLRTAVAKLAAQTITGATDLMPAPDAAFGNGTGHPSPLLRGRLSSSPQDDCGSVRHRPTRRVRKGSVSA